MRRKFEHTILNAIVIIYSLTALYKLVIRIKPEYVPFINYFNELSSDELTKQFLITVTVSLFLAWVAIIYLIIALTNSYSLHQYKKMTNE